MLPLARHPLVHKGPPGLAAARTSEAPRSAGFAGRAQRTSTSDFAPPVRAERSAASSAPSPRAEHHRAVAQRPPQLERRSQAGRAFANPIAAPIDLKTKPQVQPSRDTAIHRTATMASASPFSPHTPSAIAGAVTAIARPTRCCAAMARSARSTPSRPLGRAGMPGMAPRLRRQAPLKLQPSRVQRSKPASRASAQRRLGQFRINAASPRSAHPW